jgi:hypothetical protein
MANTWFVMIPPAYASDATAEKELVDFRIQYPYPSQAWTDANAGKILSASESTMGQQLVKWQGPFATEAQAQAAQNPQQQSVNPVNDAVNAAENSSVISTAAGLIGKTGKFIDDLTSAAFWERIAEAVIGLLLLSIGVAHLTHSLPAATAIAKHVGVASAMLA